MISPVTFQYFSLPTPINNTLNVYFLESSCDLCVCSYFQCYYLYMEYLSSFPSSYEHIHFLKPYLMWPSLCLFPWLVSSRQNQLFIGIEGLTPYCLHSIFNKVSIKVWRHRWYYIIGFIYWRSPWHYVYIFIHIFLCFQTSSSLCVCSHNVLCGLSVTWIDL